MANHGSKGTAQGPACAFGVPSGHSDKTSLLNNGNALCTWIAAPWE